MFDTRRPTTRRRPPSELEHLDLGRSASDMSDTGIAALAGCKKFKSLKFT